MAKTLLSPLLLGLLALLIYLIVSFSRWQRRDRLGRSLAVLLAVVTVVLWSLSTPAVSVRLARYLEATYSQLETDTEVDLVTVLSGGVVPGPAPELDHLGSSSKFRVVRGVRAFQELEAPLLVMQGYPSNMEQGRMTEMMKGLAVEMGVSEGRILTEPYSRNTFEHPRELLKLEEVGGTNRIAVVTSAWHLERAVREFEKHFDQVVPVPAEFYSYPRDRGVRNWLPQVDALEVSTKVFHELIGMAWYRVRNQTANNVND